MNIKEELGIKNVSDFKDGTIFVLLGCEILGSELRNTCKDYVYVKIGTKLLNHKGWFPVEAYKDIDNNFYLKKHNSRFPPSLEYEIKEIYDCVDIYNLDFDEIYKKTKTMNPIWEKDIFRVSNISIEDYFLNNFDVDIFVDDKDDKGEEE